MFKFIFMGVPVQLPVLGQQNVDLFDRTNVRYRAGNGAGSEIPLGDTGI